MDFLHQNNSNHSYDQFNFGQFNGAFSINGIQKSVSSAQSSISSYAPSNAISSPSWDAFDDIQLPVEALNDFSSENNDSVCHLSKASKKISKLNTVQDNSKKVSKKRHNRARNPWTPQEDAKLLELMKKHGQSWAMISSALPGRSGKQVRDRYINKLQPNIRCGDWTAQEDDLFIKLIKEFGNKWSLIASHLPGRTEAQVKNRYYSSIKKRLESGEAPSQALSTQNTADTPNSFTNPEDNDLIEPNFAAFNCQLFGDQDSTVNTSIHIPNFQVPQVASSCDSLSVNSCQEVDQAFPPVIENDNQVDDVLEKISSYFLEKDPFDVDCFFSDDLNNQMPVFPIIESKETSKERFLMLSKRKAYLEQALANTLKELKSL